jgi:2-oxoglutarate dehydrogenase E1 component
MCRKFRNSTFNFQLISRRESSSTATGYAKQHQAQQVEIINQAFDKSAKK